MELPILYRRASSGAILMWGIETVGATIYTHHGHVGGAIQSGEDTIREGKNLGRSNATTPEEQAQAEAIARHTKQKKGGYVVSFEDARAGLIDETLIEGGYWPLLAPNKSYPKDEVIWKAIVFPAFYQPKLDGMRCMAVIENGSCTLWTRTRKRIWTCPHVEAAYEKALPEGHWILDGELYNHEFAAEFEELISLLRGDEPDAEGRYLQAQHHVYDSPEIDAEGWKHAATAEFAYRNLGVDFAFSIAQFPDDSPIKRVPTIQVANRAELLEAYEGSLLAGYEGGMARNSAGTYDSGPKKRTKHLQKMKEFVDHEFKIVGMEEGRGKASGHVGAFVCMTEPGTYPEGEAGAPPAGAEPQEFACTPKMTYARRRELFEHPEQWRGKLLTVRLKRWTNKGKPYIPSGRAIRDYE